MVSPGSVAFTVFGLDIAWYGILIATGFLLAGGIAYQRCPLHKVDQDHFLTFVIWLVPSIIVGARAYYVLFRWDYYKENIDQILNIRGGGLAIHGGIIFGVLAAVLVCRYYKEKPLPLIDLVFTVLPLGQAIGRWGNFFNEEAHGMITDSPIAQIIDGVPYEPTFLYESVWCFLLFIFLMYYDTKKRKFDGSTASLYLMLYSVERFFVEGLRTDSLMIGILRQAQVFSIVLFLVGAALMLIQGKRSRKVKTEEVSAEPAEDNKSGEE